MDTKDRNNRGARGVTAFARSFLTSALGLSDGVATAMLKLIKTKGEDAVMKQHLRSMNSSIHKRFNQAMDMAEEADTEDGDQPNESDDSEKDSKAEDKNPKEAEKEKKEKKDKEEVKESFLSYLLKEMGDEQPAAGAIDYTGTDDKMLTSRQRQEKRKQMVANPERRQLDKKMGQAENKQQKLAAENKRHQMKMKEINAGG